jgi:hypothetical protein
MIVLWESAELWISQLTWGSVSTFFLTFTFFLMQDTAVNWMMDVGLWYEAALRVHKIATAFGFVLIWFTRSPKNVPLFSNVATKAKTNEQENPPEAKAEAKP